MAYRYWLETLQECNITVECRPRKQHSNVDGMSRPFCKQCLGKTAKRPWVDEASEGEELERAVEIAELLGICQTTSQSNLSDTEPSEPLVVLRITFIPEFLDANLAELQAEKIWIFAKSGLLIELWLIFVMCY